MGNTLKQVDRKWVSKDMSNLQTHLLVYKGVKESFEKIISQDAFQRAGTMLNETASVFKCPQKS